MEFMDASEMRGDYICCPVGERCPSLSPFEPSCVVAGIRSEWRVFDGSCPFLSLAASLRSSWGGSRWVSSVRLLRVHTLHVEIAFRRSRYTLFEVSRDRAGAGR